MVIATRIVLLMLPRKRRNTSTTIRIPLNDFAWNL